MPAVLETEGATVGPAPEGIETTVVMNKEEDAISEIPVAASTAAPIEFVTERDAVVTAAPAAPAAPTEEARAEVTTAADAKPKNKVVIEEGTDEASGEKRHSGTNGVGGSVSLLLLECHEATDRSSSSNYKG